MADLRALLGDRYVSTMRAAVLAYNPEAIKSAQQVGGKLGQLMYLSAVDRLDRTLAAVLPELLADARREGQAAAWDEGWSEGWDDCHTLTHSGEVAETPNPYRTGQADHG